MAGARSLWRANGMREEQFGRPVIGIANSFTQLVPGHVHLHEIGQYVKQRIEASLVPRRGGPARNIAVDDGIAGMTMSSPPPSREIIADSRVHGLRPQDRRAGLHSELRQDHPRHADGRHAAQHPDGLRLGRADGGRKISGPQRRPDRRHGDGGRRDVQRRADRRDRALRLPRLRIVLGHVHGQLDELSDRGAGSLAAGQRHDRRHPRQSPPAVRGRCGAHRPQCRTLLLRGRRAAASAFDRHEGRLRKRHVVRHRHGRLDQHGPAPAGRGPRGRRRFHDAGHRPPFAPGPGALQGRPQLALPHPGRQPRRRHLRHSGRTRPCRTARHLGPARRRAHAGRSDPGLRHSQQPRPARRRALSCEDPGSRAARSAPRQAITAASWAHSTPTTKNPTPIARRAASATWSTPISATADWPC